MSDPASMDGAEADADVCAVCLEPFGSDPATVERTACGHAFHAKCLLKWRTRAIASPTCPTCRSPVDPDAPPDDLTRAERHDLLGPEFWTEAERTSTNDACAVHAIIAGRADLALTMLSQLPPNHCGAKFREYVGSKRHMFGAQIAARAGGAVARGCLTSCTLYKFSQALPMLLEAVLADRSEGDARTSDECIERALNISVCENYAYGCTLFAPLVSIESIRACRRIALSEGYQSALRILHACARQNVVHVDESPACASG